jgi:hypothetical protein
MTKIKYLTKRELHKANQQAITAGCRAIDQSYAERLPEGLRYPIFFEIPWERHGWVRCQIGTATSVPPHDYMPMWLDVPQRMYNNLSSLEINESMEITQ